MITTKSPVGSRKDNEGNSITIDKDQNKIYEGKGWVFSYDMGILAANSQKTIFMTMDNTVVEQIHLRNYEFQCDASPTKVHLFESPTVSNNGDSLTNQNSNRNRVGPIPAPSVFVYENSTVDNNGELLEVHSIVGERKGGGSIDSTYEEWILDSDKTYLFIVENLSNTDAITLVANFFWYTDLK